MAEGSARRRTVVCLGGALFALFASLGHEAQRLTASGGLGASDMRHVLLTAAILFIPASLILALLLRGLCPHPVPKKDGAEQSDCARGRGIVRGGRSNGLARLFGQPFSTKRAFWFILLCYAPMFVVAFPGSFAYDVPFQLKQAFTGEYSTHHPLLHTLVLSACVALGKLAGHVNLGAALYTALQCAAMALCFALTCASIARQASARAARWSAVFFALYPLNMIFAVNATKDSLFAALFALSLALACEISATSATSRRACVRLCVCTALMLLLRNNAIYAAAAWVLVLLLMLRKRARVLAGVAALSIALAMAANGALSLATQAGKGDLSEMLSWPIQQLARVRLTRGDALTDEEREAVDELMPGEAWRLYMPGISDPVKFEFDTQALLRDPARYARVYLSVGAKCAHEYLDAILLHTYAFFYPYSEYRVAVAYASIAAYDESSDYYDGWWEGELIQNAFPRLISALSWRVGAQGAMQFPAIGWLLNMGVIVWVMLFFLLREAYAGRWARFAAASLCLLLWGTYLLGPVMMGRYIYPFACALPVLASKPAAKDN